MKRTKISLLVFVLLIVLTIATALFFPTTPKTELPRIIPVFDNAKMLAPESSAALEAVFSSIGYTLPSVKSGAKLVPNLYIRELPPDFSQITDIERRKALFIKAILPLALTVNDRLEKYRDTLIELNQPDRTLTVEEQQWVKAIAKLHKSPDQVPSKLLSRIGPLPVDLIIAQAAVESGWGTSRFATEGNALFGQWTWKKGAGIIPLEREDGETYAVRSYPSLIESVWDYAYNLNTSNSYQKFREARAQSIREGLPLDAISLMQNLKNYSQKGDAYIATLREVIKQNNLTTLNQTKSEKPT